MGGRSISSLILLLHLYAVSLALSVEFTRESQLRASVNTAIAWRGKLRISGYKPVARRTDYTTIIPSSNISP